METYRKPLSNSSQWTLGSNPLLTLGETDVFPQGVRRNGFSSWFLPIHTGHSSFMTSKGSDFGPRKGGFTLSSTMRLDRYMSFAELQAITKNFDPNNMIDVGGFRIVYLDKLDNGTMEAIKHAKAKPEQGITKFQIEIQMLLKLHHYHLVSLIRYRDENTEMTSVYKYMKHGPFKDHIYGKDLQLQS
uniref:Probable receptor-like protein kinase At4g39110 n=1 Tax=Elaeis guineensis var. tenera TaxID=51953 RepID=A0A6I9QZA9_ELAGV|nr:probable receptor-like protein kinase At4g39110 [Elaeis guineensis]